MVGGSMTSPRKSSEGGGEPFITLSGPDSICVRAVFATSGYSQLNKWGRSGNAQSCFYSRSIR